jgi:hypothetical protein
MKITKSAFHKQKEHMELSLLFNETHGLPLPLLFPASPNNVKPWEFTRYQMRKFRQYQSREVIEALAVLRKLYVEEDRNSLHILITPGEQVDDKANARFQASNNCRHPYPRTRQTQSGRTYHGHF